MKIHKNRKNNKNQLHIDNFIEPFVPATLILYQESTPFKKYNTSRIIVFIFLFNVHSRHYSNPMVATSIERAQMSYHRRCLNLMS